MKMVKLPMPVGLLIEAAVAGGVDGDLLIDVIRNKNMKALNHIGKEETSWLNFFQYADENWGNVVQAIQTGYSFKFITIRGLLNLIQTRFAFKENEDFILGDSWMALNLTQSQLEFLISRIPNQWEFVKQEKDHYNYLAVLSHSQLKV